MLTLYILSSVIFIGLFACGIWQLYTSWTLLVFLASLILLFAGISLIYFAPIYQRKQYAKQLVNKHLAIEGKSDKSPKINKVIDWFLKRRIIPSQKHLFFIAFILSVGLSLVPYANWGGVSGVLDFFTLIRKTMQMFVVDGGISEFIQSGCMPKMLQTVNDTGIIFYNCYTAILCIAAGLFFAFNILGVFAKEFYAYFDYWLVHPLSDVYVMSELNEKSITLAESIFCDYNKQNGKLRIYFCDVYSDNKEGNSELIYRAKKLGAVVMKKDITEIRIKEHAKNNTFYLIGEKEEENVEQAQQICASKEAKKTKKSLDIYIYATRQESEFIIDNMHNEEGKEDEKQKNQ